MSEIAVGGRELSLGPDKTSIYGRDREIRLPAEARAPRVYGDRLLISLKLSVDGATDPSFEIEDPTRNLVAVTPDCRLDWLVESAPPEFGARCRHKHFVLFEDRLLTRFGYRSPFCEIDPETGEILDSWGASEFTVAGTTREFDSPVTDVRRFDGKWILNTDGGAIFAIDERGELLWEFDDGNDWLLGHEGGTFYLFFDGGGRRPTSKKKFEFDPDDAEIVRSVNAPEWLADEVLDDQ